ncbi:MAG: tRNA (adenosine(37)-N6)-dimethylallyltransferase MiaA [Bacilli bacterium]|nr:tRNA (adenosine(37)-N6)-dimethylallyltransferase MiaA [Bacilli bacterium]
MIVVILGPTGVGKTKLSVELAKKLNGEIINADSTQVYKGLDIATAKVTEEEKENIPHHLFDIKEITEDYTVYDYQKDGRKVIADIIARKKTPIIVGGTGLYIKALLYDYQFLEESEKKDYSNLTDDEIYQRALEIDPNLAIHKNNRKRLERFLDYYQNNNESLSAKEKTDKLLYNTLFIGLTTERSILYERLDKRVDQMIEAGLLEEAKAIYESNVRSKAVMTPIGYKEIFPYFEGEETLDNCLIKMKQKTRNYAKRQYTWFNHQVPTKWFNVNFDNFAETIDEVFEYIKMSTK